MTSLDRQPDVGSPVHYLEVDGGRCKPGMVVAVREPASLPTGGIVDLVVGERLHPGVPRVLAERARAGTWHVPDEHPAPSRAALGPCCPTPAQPLTWDDRPSAAHRGTAQRNHGMRCMVIGRHSRRSDVSSTRLCAHDQLPTTQPR
ncbi:hypothetical protein [Amycolatopsis thermoflava]|uniref:hypothetical protein n=1 Tax=Amycolatopsis thermoflava TaxID=84480 RepID=UPI00365DE975